MLKITRGKIQKSEARTENAALGMQHIFVLIRRWSMPAEGVDVR